MPEHETAFFYVIWILEAWEKKIGSFGILSDGLWHTFSLLGVTETWLKDDDCDLYDIEGYDKLEKHIF